MTANAASGSADSRRCSRDTMTAMTRTMIMAMAATRGIEGPEEVLQGVSGPFQAAHPPFPVP